MPPLQSSQSSWKTAALALGVIVAGVCAVFGRILFHDFAGFDDSMCLYWNPHLGQPLGENVRWYWSHSFMHLYTPVVFTVWNVIAALGGKAGPGYLPRAINPQAFHAASLIVHALNAVLVFGLLRKFVRRDLAAMIGALLFALHPLQVEAVAWASGLKDLLYTTFALLSLAAYFHRPRALCPHAGPGAKGDGSDSPAFLAQAAAVAFLLLAILCKPAAVIVPVIAAILDATLCNAPTRRVARNILPMLLVAGSMAVVSRYVQPTGQQPLIGLAWRPLIAADSLAFYLKKLVMPWDLAVAYGRNPAAARASGALAYTWIIPVALAFAILPWRRHRPITAAALIFALAPLPVLGWIRFDYQRLSTVADHYVYFALFAPALLLAFGTRFVQSKPFLAIVGCLLLALALDTSRQVRHWQTNLAVWQHAVAVAPDCPEAHENLAAALGDIGPAYAADQVREYALASRLKPDDIRDHDLLTGALINAGRTDEAIAEMQCVMKLQERKDRPGIRLPNERLAAYLSLGDLLLVKNRPDEAAEMYRKILRQLPGDPTARKHLELCVFRLPREKPAAPIYLGAAE